jgi:KDO2-lipid IV(A) lauroyltransferase
MAKFRSPVVDYLVYLAVRILFCLIQAMPFSAARALARGLAWLAYHVDRRHRLVARANLGHAFPEKSPREIDALVRGTYRHFCTMLVEMVHLPRMLYPTTWRRYLDLAAGRPLVDVLLSGRPVLLLTGHLGNWELSGFMLGLLGFRSYAIARRLDNAYLHEFLMHRFRQRTGQRILSKDGDFEKIQAVLSGGGALGTLADQDAGQRGLFVDYFGRPASTHKAIALLALQHRATMLVIGTVRVGEPFRYCCLCEDAMRPEEYDGRPDAVTALTQRFTAALERIVRRHPEQYLWLHRRWKHQPRQRKSKSAA